MELSPGGIVQCRHRDWVLLPSDQPHLVRLRPLTGAGEEVVVHRQLAELVAYELEAERVRPSQFPLPRPEHLGDAASVHLLWQAARLLLREGATPLRSLGRLSFTPRVYQFVPLLMALRLDPVRLFIADDVGVGKTIEALLIARELWDRGEIRRLAVLCPPSLCDQWQQELVTKFHLDAVVIRSGTVGALDRCKPGPRSLYEYYPVQVVSIDFVKSERNKHAFLLHAPELVIVDEAHGAAEAGEERGGQQQRHALLRQIAEDPRRHLILLTATPHSGIEGAFRSLLGLLDPRFARWNLSQLDESQRTALGRHYVQRTRCDIQQEWESQACFPRRLSLDRTYRLSPACRTLLEKTFAFCAEIVRTGEQLRQHQRRVRYWAALALLRCVMSSPPAAQAALRTRHERVGERLAAEEEDGQEAIRFRDCVFEADRDRTADELPTPPIAQAETMLLQTERRKLRELEQLAAALLQPGQDTKLEGLIEVLLPLLSQGCHPIVWCRYVATAEYVAQSLRERLASQHPEVQVLCLTGRQPEEERRTRLDNLQATCPRVLVATDCLSEGINLQEMFNAAIHYDLPWNPNRLEQREGRVDRYGQPAAEVKVIRYYGADNPIDGVVLEVLLNKAREIYETLGTYVPVPEESQTVTEAVLHALFLRATGRLDPAQRRLAFADEWEHLVQPLHRSLDQEAQWEKQVRTRFAQRALKPQAVRDQLAAVDAVLGDAQAVQNFVLQAAQRLHLALQRDKRHPEVFLLPLDDSIRNGLPAPLREALPTPQGRTSSVSRTAGSLVWRISFSSPTPQGAEYLGRNHRFVEALARYLLEQALENPAQAAARRCGAIRTRAVSTLTTLLLLRVRYLLEIPPADLNARSPQPLLAEEVLVCGYEGPVRGRPQWLPEHAALTLLAQVQPDANLPQAEKQELAAAALDQWTRFHHLLEPRIADRARQLADAHKRIRQAVHLRVRDLAVRPQLPPDLIGLVVLQPLVQP